MRYRLICATLLITSYGYASTLQPAASQPICSPLTETEAFDLATKLAQLGPGRLVGDGQGRSMWPLYTDRTVLVTTPLEYEKLQAGMVVAYRDDAGSTVVHVVVRRQGMYWVAKGLHNAHEDLSLVTPQNFLGIIYATLY